MLDTMSNMLVRHHSVPCSACLENSF